MSVRKAAMMTSGFAIGLLAIPTLLLSLPESPNAAPYLSSNHVSLSLDHVTANIAARGAGSILSVEGSVTNTGSAAVLIPPIDVTVTDRSGAQQTHRLGTRLGILSGGDTLQFTSAQAVTSTTKGTIAIGFRNDNAVIGANDVVDAR